MKTGTTEHVDIDEFRAWLSDAPAGDRVEYACGELSVTTESCQGGMHRKQALSDLRNAIQEAFDGGQITLAQVATNEPVTLSSPCRRFRYFAIKLSERRERRYFSTREYELRGKNHNAALETIRVEHQ
jgi:hypothetical protein